MKHLLSVLVVAMMFFIPGLTQAAGAALMTLDSTDYFVERGEQFDLTVRVTPNGEALDTVRAVVMFDPALLQVQNVSLTGAFDRVAPGNYYDNTTGTVSWGAFTLDGPVTASTSFITISFLGLQEGKGEVELSEGSRAISSGEERIDAQSFGTSEVSVTASTTAQAGTALIIVESASHVNTVDWYTNNAVDFSWTALQGDSELTAYYYAFDQSSDTDPTTYLDATTTQIAFEDVTDGVHYFHVKGVQADGSTTAVSHRRVNVDATAPHPIELTVQDNKILVGESAWFIFATIDDTSGVLQYQIAINDSAYQVQESPLEMTDLQAGTYFFRVAAFDRAGNASYGSTSVRVYPEGTDLSRPEGYVEDAEIAAIAQASSEKTWSSSENSKLLISLILGIAVVIGIIYAIKKRKIKS
ncbi:MAG: cohesin domain-containing protein [Patescibacteria group bacterium]